MNQLAIQFWPTARRKDPATSHQAAAQARELALDHHGLILSVLYCYGPQGKDGIAARTSLTGVAVCRRLTELQRMGKIAPTGRVVASAAGRSEREWGVYGG